MKKVFVLLLCQILMYLGCLSLGGQLQEKKSKVKEPLNSETQKEQSREWQSATYRGLTMGKSSYSDMIQVFGAPLEPVPNSKDEDSNLHSEAQYFYRISGEFHGELIVGIDNKDKKIIWIRLSPKDLSKEEAIAHFGSDYIITRYDFDDCVDNVESVPVFESPNGPIILIEYRNRGIFFGVKNDNQVEEISYISKPPGFSKSKCIK